MKLRYVMFIFVTFTITLHLQAADRGSSDPVCDAIKELLKAEGTRDSNDVVKPHPPTYPNPNPPQKKPNRWQQFQAGCSRQWRKIIGNGQRAEKEPLIQKK